MSTSMRLGRSGGSGETRRFLTAPVVPGAGEVRRAAGFELEDGVRDRFEEPAVVRDEEDGGVDRLQLALEPFEARHVEVVRRLVEEQEVWVAAERACERGAGQLSAREAVEGPVEVVRREAEVAGDGVEPLAPGVAARVLEARLGLGVGAERRRLVVAARPWRLRGGVALARRRSGRRRRRGRSRAAWRRSRRAGAGRGARSACPWPSRSCRRGARSPRSGAGAASSCRRRSARRATRGRGARP